MKIFYIYLSIPLILLVCLLDYFFFNKVLQIHLPSSPEEYLILSYLIAGPHIVASLITLADKEYLNNYSKSILFQLVLLVFSLVGVITFLGINIYLIIYDLWTSYHVWGQQQGIGIKFSKVQNFKNKLYKYLGFILFTIIIAKIYSLELSHHVEEIDLNQIAIPVIGLLSLLTFFIDHKTSEGRIMNYINTLSLVLGYYLVTLGYSFLLILMYRVVHDITAFMFYINHDKNRNKTKINNFIFIFPRKIIRSQAVVTFIVAFVISIPISFSENYGGKVMIFFTTIFAFSHYLVDSKIWKSGSLHRKNLTLS